MTVLAGMAALATATCLGYYFGRRAGSTPSTWRKRTGRIALGKLTLSLLVLLTARRIQRGFRSERTLADAARLWGPRLIAPLELLRGSVVSLAGAANGRG